jgi:hypothetical protein
MKIFQLRRSEASACRPAANPRVTPSCPLVRVVEESTSQIIELQTDSAGEYTAGNLTPGAYTIQVEKRGFAGHIKASFDGGADGSVPQDPTNRNADWASSDVTSTIE